MKAGLSKAMCTFLWFVVSLNTQAATIPVGPPISSNVTFNYHIKDYNNPANTIYQEIVPLVGDTGYSVSLSHVPVENASASVVVSGGALSSYLSAGQLNTSTGSINGRHALHIDWDIRYKVPANAKSAGFIIDKSLMHLRGTGYDQGSLDATLAVNVDVYNGETGDTLSDLRAAAQISGKTHDVGDGDWSVAENGFFPGITAEELRYIPPFLDRPGYYTSESFTWDGLDIQKRFPVEGISSVIFLYSITLAAESDEAAEGIARIEFGDPFDADGIKTQFYDTAVVPLPAAVWLFASGLIGFIALAKRSNQAV